MSSSPREFSHQTNDPQAAVIDLYTWSTPNGRKVSILLEELAIPYRVFPVDIAQGEQFKGRLAQINPNHKIPVIEDRETGMTLMESGAILLYLANRSGRLLSPTGPAYWDELQWLMFQTGHIGPMLGQTHHFVKFNPGKSPYAEERYHKETRRLYSVVDARLRGRDFLCGDYSIVDIATWPWISRFDYQQMNLRDFPNLHAWYLRIAERPAVQRGYSVPEKLAVPLPD